MSNLGSVLFWCSVIYLSDGSGGGYSIGRIKALQIYLRVATPVFPLYLSATSTVHSPFPPFFYSLVSPTFTNRRDF